LVARKGDIPANQGFRQRTFADPRRSRVDPAWSWLPLLAT